MSEIYVIFDGQCQLCKNSLSWVAKKLKIEAVDYHIGDLARFNLTAAQCAHEVFVVYEHSKFSGAEAVAFLLKQRGNKSSAFLITALGPVSRFCYRWVARNRNSRPVKILSYLLRR